MHGTAISVSSLLCRSMLKFINSLLHYLTSEASLTNNQKKRVENTSMFILSFTNLHFISVDSYLRVYNLHFYCIW